MSTFPSRTGSHGALAIVAPLAAMLAALTGCGSAAPPEPECAAASAGAALDRRIALLDLSEFDESTSDRTAITQALRLAGVPFVTTTSAATALNHQMVVVSSVLDGGHAVALDAAALTAYVEGGGVLVAPRVQEPTLVALFGVTSGGLEAPTSTRAPRTWIHFQPGTGDPGLRWLDDPLEQSIRLHNPEKSFESSAYFKTYGYALAEGAVAVATFDDGARAALVRQGTGEGAAYTFGVRWKDLILRGQLNADLEAQRTYSNGFEPGSDVIALFIRGLYQSLVPHAVHKHTSPGSTRSVLVLTHDVDAQSAIDLMNDFAGMERDRGFEASYLVTTHYISDWNVGNYYDWDDRTTPPTPNLPRFQALAEATPYIGSHSVGHFPDWNLEERFPQGTPGNTRETYLPRYGRVGTAEDGTPILATTGGTVYGELEVSKDLLEADLHVPVRVFRSGHLWFNRLQIDVMEALGYRYDSSFSANDVLTSFPYAATYGRSYATPLSSIYVLPMHISDARMDELDGLAPDEVTLRVQERVALWLQVIERNASNFAPNVLLIHPNRAYKLAAEISLLDALPEGIAVTNLETYGDFWRARDALAFDVALTPDALTITIPDTAFPVRPDLSLFVDDAAALGEGQLVVQWSNGTAVGPVSFTRTPWDTGVALLHGFAPVPVVPPEISSVSPTKGPTLGGTVVTLSGSGFLPGSVVQFGETPASVTFESNTWMTAVAPPHAAGVVSITVRNPDGGTGTRLSAFTYVAAKAPTVKSVSPGWGPPEGETAVTVTGSGFGSGAAVLFGDVQAAVTSIGATTIVCISPPQAQAAVPVTVINADGQSATWAGAFQYVVPPAPPQDVEATPGAKRILVSWTASPGATSYTVWRATALAGPFSRLASNVTTTSLTDNTVKAGAVYHYKVTATNVAGTSPDSSVVSASPL
jgi:hypothetical protein